MVGVFFVFQVYMDQKLGNVVSYSSSWPVLLVCNKECVITRLFLILIHSNGWCVIVRLCLILVHASGNQSALFMFHSYGTAQYNNYVINSATRSRNSIILQNV